MTRTRTTPSMDSIALSSPTGELSISIMVSAALRPGTPVFRGRCRQNLFLPKRLSAPACWAVPARNPFPGRSRRKVARRAGTAEAAGRGGFCAGFSGGVAEAGLLPAVRAGFSTRFQSLYGGGLPFSGFVRFQQRCTFGE